MEWTKEEYFKKGREYKWPENEIEIEWQKYLKDNQDEEYRKARAMDWKEKSTAKLQTSFTPLEIPEINSPEIKRGLDFYGYVGLDFFVGIKLGGNAFKTADNKFNQINAIYRYLRSKPVRTFKEIRKLAPNLGRDNVIYLTNILRNPKALTIGLKVNVKSISNEFIELENYGRIDIRFNNEFGIVNKELKSGYLIKMRVDDSNEGYFCFSW